MKLNLNDVSGGYNLQVINENFSKIEQELGERVLYRDNPTGSPNSMSSPLDMNSQSLYNLPAPSSPSSAARLQDILDSTAGIVPASGIVFVPYQNITSTNVQEAIQEIIDDVTVPNGSADITYTQGSTGSVVRTLQAKQRETVSVMDFGAVGNGVADDRPAFQAAATYLASLPAGGRVIVPQPPVEYLFKTKHASGHGVVLTGPAIVIEGEGYTQIKADIAMNCMFYVNSVNSSFTSLKNLILQCNSLAQSGFSSQVIGSNLRMEKVFAYDALADGLVINAYSAVLDHCSAFRSGAHNIKVLPGGTSVVMIQPNTGSIAHALSSIYIGQTHYSTLISPTVDGAVFGIEIGSSSEFYSPSVTVIEPGFENVGTHMRITNASVNIVGGTSYQPTAAPYMFEFIDSDVSVNSTWNKRGTLGHFTSLNVYSITRGTTSFARRADPSAITMVGGQLSNAVTTSGSVGTRNIYINESGGVDAFTGETSGQAVKTWSRVSELIGTFVDMPVQVFVTNATAANIQIGGFVVRGAGAVQVQPASVCAYSSATIKNVTGGAGSNSVDFKNFAASGPVNVLDSTGVIVRGITMGSGINGVNAIRSQVEVAQCTVNDVAYFIIAGLGANVHSRSNTGNATVAAAYAGQGGRLTREGTQPTGVTQAVTGGQIV